MDIHLQTNPTLHFRVNGGQRSNSRSSAEDEALQFLSQEEQECIQFFEETIDSLEESLDQEERSGPEPVQLHALETSSGTSGPSPGSSSASSPGPSSGTSGPSPGSSSASSPGPSSGTSGPSAVPPMADGRGPRDQDIIDLLQPDLVQTREAFFDPSMPDFQNMVRTPDSHVDARSSKRDLMDTLPSEYNPPLPSSGCGPYHPPLPSSGCGPYHPPLPSSGCGPYHPPLPSSGCGPYHPPLPSSGCGPYHPPLPSSGGGPYHPPLPSSGCGPYHPPLPSSGCSPYHPPLPSSGCGPYHPPLPSSGCGPYHPPLPSSGCGPYNPPLPSSGCGPYHPPLPSSGCGPYPPPGSVPTPVLMAQKMAHNLRRGSLDSDKPALSHASSFKQGPPTSTKPSRFPANISVTQSHSSSHSNSNNQSLASVSIHERRAQMLANLTGTCHPLEATPPAPPPSEKDRNLPTRSVSFRDPTPAQSRMEALSKLGLTRNRARSGGSSPPVTPLPPTSDTPVTPLPPTDTPVTPLPPTTDTPVTPLPPTYTPVTPLPPTDTTDTGTSATRPSQPLVAETRAQTAALPDPISSPETIEGNPSPPSAVTQSTDWPPPPPPPESQPAVAPTPPGVASLDFNTYGGKGMVVNPSASDRREPSVSEGWVGHDGKAHPSLVVATLSDYNSYGGKSKVMTPAPAPLPDILSSHRAPPSPGGPYEVNSYGGKTRSITPSSRGRMAPQAPSPAPKPIHHHRHGPSLSTPQKAPSPEPTRQRSVSKPSPEPTRQRSVSKPSPEPTRQRSVSKPSPEPTRRKSVSKPAAFRSQGITVQFSGRGATDESRRDALRKLGLLKDTC